MAATSGRFHRKFTLTVVPGLVASGIAASVLYGVHAARHAPAEYRADPAPQTDGLSADERRDLTRQMLKARRENAQEPERVRPAADAAAAPDPGGLPPLPRGVAGAAADAGAVPDAATASPKAADAGEPAGRPADDNARTLAARPPETRPPETRQEARPADARPAAVRAERTARPAAPDRPARPPRDGVTRAGAAAPPSFAAAPPPATAPAGTPMAAGYAGPPYGAQASAAPAPAPPEQPGLFSGLSSIVGSAANAVIDLPGKAISTGGRLLGGADHNASAAPPAPPAPAADPPR